MSDSEELGGALVHLHRHPQVVYQLLTATITRNYQSKQSQIYTNGCSNWKRMRHIRITLPLHSPNQAVIYTYYVMIYTGNQIDTFQFETFSQTTSTTSE